MANALTAFLQYVAPVLVQLIQPVLVWDAAKFPSEHRDCRAAQAERCFLRR